MSTPAWKRALFWPLAGLLVVFGTLCVLFPLVMLGPWDPGAHLLHDTRAALGGGRASVLTVSRARCSRMEFGHDGDDSVHSIEYDCEFELQSPAPPPLPEPDYAHMDRAQQAAAYDAAEKAWLERLRASTRERGPNDPPASLFRRLPRDVSARPLPTVREFASGGEPKRYGLVWADGGLGGRWFRWGWETSIFWGFAFLCFVALPALRRKLR
jgi:hypothetical protein